jgi:type III pantothenate kinase
MLLAIDIGNTNMEFGVYKSDKLIAQFRIGTNREITSDEVGLFMSQFFLIQKINLADIKDVIITSVVPQVMYSVNNAMRKYLKIKPLVVGENIFVDIQNKYDNPKEVGSDRLVNSFGAYKKYGGDLIVVDFGTATTFDVVASHGEYLGGVIFPGIKISMDALFKNASKLPKIELAMPKKAIGTTTVGSMQAGAINGYVGVVKNIVDGINNELNKKMGVIATGGLAKLIGSQYDFKAIDRSLTLDSLFLIYKDKIITQEK